MECFLCCCFKSHPAEHASTVNPTHAVQVQMEKYIFLTSSLYPFWGPFKQPVCLHMTALEGKLGMLKQLVYICKKWAQETWRKKEEKKKDSEDLSITVKHFILSTEVLCKSNC